MSERRAAAVESSAVAGRVLDRERRTLTIGLVLAITLVGFEGLAVATVMPAVSRDLHGIGLYGWAFSAFFLGNLVGIVAAGHGADRGSVARPFSIGLLLFAAGLVGAGCAPTMLTLVIARTVQGIGAGAIPAVAYVAIGRGYPSVLQARMFAVISTAWVLPGVVGPAISGAVADAFGWRWVFLGLLPLVVANGVLTARALRDLPPGEARGPGDQRVDALWLAIGAGLVLTGVSSRQPFVAIVLVAVGMFVGGRSFTRLMPTGTLRLSPGLPAATALRGIFTFAFFGTDAYVSLTLTSLRGASITIAGIALTGATLSWAAGAWIQERRTTRTGPRTFVVAGALIIILGIAGMIVVANVAVPIAVAVAAWSVAGLGMGLAYTPQSLIVLAEAPEGNDGRAVAALALCETLGIALGTGATGAVIAAGNTLGWDGATALTIAFSGCAVVAAFAAVGARRLPARLPA